MKQTVVQWLEQEFIKLESTVGVYHVMYELIEQAKEMEKEQIIDSHIEGQRVFDKHPHTQWTNDQAEQYYNETYRNDPRIPTK